MIRAAVVVLAGLVLVSGCAREREAQAPRGSAAPESTRAAEDSLYFIARGNEPFWAVTVTRQGIVFSEPERLPGIRGDFAPAAHEGDRMVFRTTLRDTVDLPLELTLLRERCQDSMSGFESPYSAVARVGDRVLRGCADDRPPRRGAAGR